MSSSRLSITKKKIKIAKTSPSLLNVGECNSSPIGRYFLRIAVSAAGRDPCCPPPPRDPALRRHDLHCSAAPRLALFFRHRHCDAQSRGGARKGTATTIHGRRAGAELARTLPPWRSGSFSSHGESMARPVDLPSLVVVAE
jgi:hypothetical protein